MLPGFKISTNRSKSTSNNLSKSVNCLPTQEKAQKLLPYQRREQLKALLVVKFMKKYGFKQPEDFLEEEVNKFVVSEKLSEKDLRRLDQRIKQIYEERKMQKTLQYALSTKHKNNVLRSEIRNMTNGNNENRDNTSVYSCKGSVASNVSNKSRAQSAVSNSARNRPQLFLHKKKPDAFDHKIGESNATIENNQQNMENDGGDYILLTGENEKKNEGEEREGEGTEILKNEENKDKDKFNIPNKLQLDDEEDPTKLDRFEFVGGDEWHAIVDYNYKKYLEDMRLNRLKDLEVKKRVRDDLEIQMREKMMKQEQEKIISRQYDDMQDKHVYEMNELEKKKLKEYKDKFYVLKNSRDELLKDEKYRKKSSAQQERFYEKEQLKKIREEIDRYNRSVVERKAKEKETVQKLISENEVKQQKLKELEKIEKVVDGKLTEEYIKLMELQDIERNNLFKSKLRKQSEETNKQIENVLKDIERKRKIEEEKVVLFEKEKERKEKILDEIKLKNRIFEKNNMRTFLNMQVEQKKKGYEVEKEINACQAKVWSEDVKKFHDQERELSEKIRSINKMNSDFVKYQIESKTFGSRKGMTDTEFLLNKNLLSTINNANKRTLDNVLRNSTKY